MVIPRLREYRSIPTIEKIISRCDKKNLRFAALNQRKEVQTRSVLQNPETIFRQMKWLTLALTGSNTSIRARNFSNNVTARSKDACNTAVVYSARSEYCLLTSGENSPFETAA